MIGYITQENPPAIVLEYAPFGNLHDFLVKFRDEVRAKQNITTINVIIYYYIFLCTCAHCIYQRQQLLYNMHAFTQLNCVAGFINLI